jgi:hypothetical protein
VHLAWLLKSSQKFMSRRQTTFWDRRGVLPGLPPLTLLLYDQRGSAARELPRLPSSAYMLHALVEMIYL